MSIISSWLMALLSLTLSLLIFCILDLPISEESVDVVSNHNIGVISVFPSHISMHISKWVLFFSPFKKHKEIFLQCFLWEPDGTQGEIIIKVRGPPKTCSSGVYSSQTCPHWISSTSSIVVQLLLPQPWFPGRFLLKSFCSGSCDSLY